MDLQLNKQDKALQLLESDYLSMTDGLDKIFLKKFKKSKKHMAVNDKKFTDEEMEEYKAGQLLNWDFFMGKK
ncbi:hypothetical protein [Flavobacterium sp. H122]|uniref:hypothetical protein n=1 Tax=Flavobacterium sp. H122 TaxID=2529860 RepID=UPI0010AB14E5|nr:hypothetical protein [Flavobacterium sp. H122]